MMKLNPKLFYMILAGSLLAPIHAVAGLVSSECRPLQINEEIVTGPAQYDKGILWKIKRPGIPASYVFGTIHVADEKVLDLPVKVMDALQRSKIFVMEALPDVEQTISLYSMMFFSDGRKLDGMLSKTIFDRAVEILDVYQMPKQAVTLMKPWAAFLTMNYPPNMGTVLDLELLKLARENGAELHGLETMEEQTSILNNLDLNFQLRLLIDTVCHYDLVKQDFEKMKAFYLERDLKGLFKYSNRYVIAEDEVYEILFQKLLTERNYLMVRRMQDMLERGSAFIAIGALHLPGKDGVLHLLKQKNYSISVVY